MTIRIIVATSKNGVIGRDGTIPWHYSADISRFKRLTVGTNVIMGRITYESIGRPLRDRRNIVVTSQEILGEHSKDLTLVKSVKEGLDLCTGDVWLIGGYGVYREGMGYADEIDLTTVPEIITGGNVTLFPYIDSKIWMKTGECVLFDDYRIKNVIYRRKRLSNAAKYGI